MAYKGGIKAGSTVEAELQLNNRAKGTALLVLSFADNGGGSGTDQCIVAPAASGACSAKTNAGVTGMVRVWADLNAESDGARLITRVNGAERDSEQITGDTTWSYSLA